MFASGKRPERECCVQMVSRGNKHEINLGIEQRFFNVRANKLCPITFSQRTHRGAITAGNGVQRVGRTRPCQIGQVHVLSKGTRADQGSMDSSVVRPSDGDRNATRNSRRAFGIVQ